MTQRHIIYLPGKNPKPPADQHRDLLWRTLLEGIRRVDPAIADDLKQQAECFKFIGWNYHYYHSTDDIGNHKPWADALLKKQGPTEEDIKGAKAWNKKLDQLIHNTFDYAPVLLRLLPGGLRATAEETNRYFQNVDSVASNIREYLKQELRPVLNKGDKVLLIAHSFGSVIAYDTLWALSQLEQLEVKLDMFLTIGSPLGMNYVQRRLLGNQHNGEVKYPSNIRNWVNISAEGDVTTMDRCLSDDFHEMVKFGMVESIDDNCEEIYNYFHDENGLNCHRSHGYLINTVMAETIVDWWKDSS